MKKKKLYSFAAVLMIIAMLTAVLSVAAVADDGGSQPDEIQETVSPTESGGYDELTNTYYIKTKEQFIATFDILRTASAESSENALECNIVLLADIDMTGEAFEHVAAWKGGLFDGRGHVISNLTSNATCYDSSHARGYCEDNAALFGRLCQGGAAIIRNVIFSNLTLELDESRDTDVAIFVGLLDRAESIILENVVTDVKFVGSTVRNLGYFVGNSRKATPCTVNNCVLILSTESTTVTVDKSTLEFNWGWCGSESTVVTNTYVLNATQTSSDNVNKVYYVAQSDVDTMLGGDAEALGDGFIYAEGKCPMPLYFGSTATNLLNQSLAFEFVLNSERTYAPAPLIHTVTWVIDESISYTSTVIDGMKPVFPPEHTDSKGKPSKAGDEEYIYKFRGWTPAIAFATEDVTYTAVFTKVPNPDNKKSDTDSADGSDMVNNEAQTTTEAVSQTGGCNSVIGTGAAFAFITVFGMSCAVKKRK